MGFSEKPQVVEGGHESSPDNTKKWVIAGIALRGPLKPIYTTPVEKTQQDDVDVETEECLTTPTGEESRIRTPSTCPPAPRKPKPPSFKCKYRGGGVRKFFTPPDLETVFIRHVERAS